MLELIYLNLLRLIANSGQLASLEFMKPDLKAAVLNLVDEGYLEFSETISPEEWREVFADLGVPGVLHIAEITQRGLEAIGRSKCLN